MAAILDALRSRARQRELNAADLIAEAARAAASGATYDLGAVENALRDQCMTLNDFEAAVGRARQRALWLSQFDRLNTATNRAAKLQAAIDAEEERFAAQRLAAAEKVRGLQAELDVQRAACDAGTEARAQLLNPASVPGTIGERYREAVAARDSARAIVSRHSSELRDMTERLDVEQSFLNKGREEEKRTIYGNGQAASHHADQSEREARCDSIRRRIGEIDKSLATAQRDLTAAEAAVKKLEIEVLAV